LLLQLFCMFMLYVFIAMATREGVLLLNGSAIRPWWIWHHYISAFTCVLFIMMPVDSPAVQRYVEGWLHWTVFQAVLMLAQNRSASCYLVRTEAWNASSPSCLQNPFA
jgi:hypothetical protein